MTIFTDVLLLLFIISFITDAVVTLIKDYKGKDASQQRQERQDIHNASQKGIDYIESFITKAIISAAKNVHLNTGLEKRNGVKTIVEKALADAHLNVPDYLINILIDSAYETTKQFIKNNHVDSRENNTTDPSKLNDNEIQAKINGSK